MRVSNIQDNTISVHMSERQSAAEDLVMDPSMMDHMTPLMHNRPTSNLMLTAKHKLGCKHNAIRSLASATFRSCS